MTSSNAQFKQAELAMDTHSLNGLRERAFNPDDKQALMEAAQQFEAILLRQMLSSARSTDFGGNDLFGESDDTFREMRDARFAEVTAESGQLGFAAAIETQLARFLPEGGD